MKRILGLVACLAAGTVSCETNDSVYVSAESSEGGLNPGSDASVVSDTVPTTMAPGERRFVSVTMQNDGLLTDGSNDWDSGYLLFRNPGGFGWSATRVQGTITPTNSYTFGFVIQAPASPGTYTFGARMRAPGGVKFGETLTVTVTVSAAVTPAWDCAEVLPGTFNTTFLPSERRVETITVENTGTETWPASDLCLRATDSPASFWGANTCIPLNTSVPPNGTANFTAFFEAPATPGTYSFTRQMLDSGPTGVGFFSTITNCVSRTITVSGAAALASTLTSATFPLTLPPGERRLVTVSAENDGTETWTAGDFTLNADSSALGVTVVSLPSNTAPGNTADFVFTITAPRVAGDYSVDWRMRKTTGGNSGPFGDVFAMNVTVDPTLSATFDAELFGTFPARVTAGQVVSFEVEARNTGTDDWVGSDFALASANSPASLWGQTLIRLSDGETVAAGDARTFTFNVTAPEVPGTYTSAWRMRETVSFGPFGQTTPDTVVVTECGNDVVDAGETCDDNNLVSGDGCSDDCQLETETIELASQSVDVTLFGSTQNKSLCNIAIGDLTSDGPDELIVGENAHVVPTNQGFRNQAGIVYIYDGAFSFAPDSPSTVPEASSRQVWGADANDSLGAVESGMFVGDVAGDLNPDLVLTAMNADGTGNTRSDCGEVYVILGGSTLTSTTVVDLRQGTANPLVAAIYEGSSAGDRLRALGASADLFGDGKNDLVLGAPGAGARGEAYIVRGSLSVDTGSVAISALPSADIITITPPNPGSLGTLAATGDLNDDGQDDVVFSCINCAPGGRSRTGAAYVVFGPITSDIDLSLSPGTFGGPDIAIFGETPNDLLSFGLAIGQVTGDASEDLVIGAPQARLPLPRGQTGAVYVFEGPLEVGTIDLSVNDAFTSVVYGEERYDFLGASVELVDVNSDFRLDIVTAAGAADGISNGSLSTGEGYVFAGLVDRISPYPLVRVVGSAQRDLLGYKPRTVGAGDLNGDGSGDVCFGLWQAEGAGGLTSAGRIDCRFGP
ncbi:MAG: NBR1-Ig-like domain-containing protein [Myxococcota bacterium]